MGSTSTSIFQARATSVYMRPIWDTFFLMWVCAARFITLLSNSNRKWFTGNDEDERLAIDWLLIYTWPRPEGTIHLGIRGVSMKVAWDRVRIRVRKMVELDFGNFKKNIQNGIVNKKLFCGIKFAFYNNTLNSHDDMIVRKLD